MCLHSKECSVISSHDSRNSGKIGNTPTGNDFKNIEEDDATGIYIVTMK